LNISTAPSRGVGFYLAASEKLQDGLRNQTGAVSQAFTGRICSFECPKIVYRATQSRDDKRDLVGLLGLSTKMLLLFSGTPQHDRTATSYIIPRPIWYDFYFESLMLQDPLSFEAGRVEEMDKDSGRHTFALLSLGSSLPLSNLSIHRPPSRL
jgi:hypothetical protein